MLKITILIFIIADDANSDKSTMNFFASPPEKDHGLIKPQSIGRKLPRSDRGGGLSQTAPFISMLRR